MISQIRRNLLGGVLKKRRRKRKGSIVIVSPSQSVGGIGLVRQAAPRGLRQIQRHIDAASVFEQKISKVVGSNRVIGLNRQCFLIHGLGLLPVSLGFISPTKSGV